MRRCLYPILLLILLVICGCSANRHIPEKYIEACKDIADEKKNELCLIDQAVMNGHMTFCGTAVLENEQQCYEIMAREFHDPFYCKKVKDSDGCFQTAAIWNDDPDICGSIVDLGRQKACVNSVNS